MKDPKLATRLDLSDTLNYDNGKLKDATTPTAKDGTLINSWLLSDIRTVFTRAVKIAGTVFSGNFDTDNSSQLFDALKKAINEDSGWVEVTEFETGNTTGDDAANGKLRVRKINNIVYITGSYNETGTNGFTLPVGFRPDVSVGYRTITVLRSGDYTIHPKTIDASGNVYELGGTTAALYYFNAFFPIDPTI